MEYVQSYDSGIFWSWWPKVVSPYSFDLEDCEVDPEAEAGLGVWKKSWRCWMKRVLLE